MLEWPLRQITLLMTCLWYLSSTAFAQAPPAPPLPLPHLPRLRLLHPSLPRPLSG